MITFILVPAIILLIFKSLFRNKLKDINGRHVVVTGGSSGIGLSAAIIAAKRGAHVTIIARNVDRLGTAKAKILEWCKSEQKVTAISVDVSNPSTVTHELHVIEEKVGSIYMLINCAGQAICGVVEDFSVADIKTLIDVNYLGTLYPIQAVVPGMKARNEGIIVVTASQAALIGMFGYSIYSSCKFALRGLAESLRMELKPFNISVTLSLPPDTDTPGYENENKTKPEETKLISESGGLADPNVVAEALINDALVTYRFRFFFIQYTLFSIFYQIF